MPPSATDAASNNNARLHLLARRTAPNAVAIDYTIAIDLDQALAAALPQLCAGLPPALQEPSAVLRNLPLLLKCEIGRATVPYATLDALRLGDILFFNPHMNPADDNLAVLLNYRRRPLLRARIQPSDLMVITDIDMNDRKAFSFDDLVDEQTSGPLSNPFDAIAASDPIDEDDDYGYGGSDIAVDERPAHDSLSQLPLQVTFDVGDCEMCFSELQKLQPGSIIPLTSKMPEVVRVSVNGRVIASGELIEIDGKIGVMLARLADTR
jgi:type III secretion system YscQ/HrcQ family protein